MIEVEHLTKRYGGVLAVDDVSFSVEDGMICGLLGPNGAGKSTTMNIMTGCLAATSGEVRYDGLEIYADMDVVKRSIGYLPEQPPLYPDMTAGEYLVFVGRAKGLTRADAEDEALRLGKLCGVEDVEYRLIKNLSKGYRQRIGIAQALIGDPKVVVLDEPTVGLDPIQIIEIRDLVHHLGENRTVLVSSHILSEIRALCGRIVIISKGRVVADDTPEGLERMFAGSRTTVVTVRADEDVVRAALSGLPEVESLALVRGPAPGLVQASLSTAQETDVREAVFFAFASRNAPILEMTTQQVTLEDVFVELTSPEAAAAAGEVRAVATAATEDAKSATTAAEDARSVAPDDKEDAC